jgi:hypothetical protein
LSSGHYIYHSKDQYNLSIILFNREKKNPANPLIRLILVQTVARKRETFTDFALGGFMTQV